MRTPVGDGRRRGEFLKDSEEFEFGKVKGEQSGILHGRVPLGNRLRAAGYISDREGSGDHLIGMDERYRPIIKN